MRKNMGTQRRHGEGRREHSAVVGAGGSCGSSCCGACYCSGAKAAAAKAAAGGGGWRLEPLESVPCCSSGRRLQPAWALRGGRSVRALW